ncbi:MAG: ribonuclease [Planctomycetota bacterium]|nr:ribonuclease [Planctomycetota bacterium]
MSQFDDKILGLVSRADYRPITLKAMSRRFQVGPEDYAEFRSGVKAMVREGKLAIGKDKTLSKATEPAKGLIVGTYRRSAKGFGFVRPLKSEGRSQDIFIPPDAGTDASSGDLVAVKIMKRSHTPGTNSEGKIVRVIERASGVFVGTYFEEGTSDSYVKVDGTTFQAPIYVGDPGAKGAKPGDKVAIEMVRYPSPEIEGEGVITEILGQRGQPGVDTLTVIRAFNIPDVFDDDTLEDAREQAKKFNEKKIEGRLDLRDVPTVTIDPATARDFDDAISLSRDDRGYWNLGVHIADVSHFVRAGSPLDQTARNRGTSVYLPDRVIPMLPEVLSNSLASLQQGHVRYTMSVFIEFDATGVRTDRVFARSAIRVDKRFSYEEAFSCMEHPETPVKGVSPEVRSLLHQMLELARILRRRRFKRGALELTIPKVEVELGDHGEVVGAHLSHDDESHSVIEEFMLAANEAVASFLTEKHVAFLRRTHADPDPGKLKQFAEFAASLGYPIENPLSRYDIQKVLDETADKPERYAIHYGLLRSLKQATYSPEIEGHYALASEDYCHFTSPIRRYPDLQVHRQLGMILDKKKPTSDLEELVALAEHCNRTERRAEMAERELVKIKLLTHLEGRIGESFHAIIVGVEDFGLFVQLVELPIDGLLHVTTLGDDYYYLESETHSLIGRRSGRRFRLGDRMDVRVARVDVDRRELDLVPTDRDPEAPAPPARPRTRSPRVSAPRAKDRLAPPKKSKGKGKRKG